MKFLSRGSGYTLFLTQDGATLALRGKKGNAALRMKVLGANANAAIAGTNGLPGKSNYFIGNDPAKWRTNVPTYSAVKYASVYPGIDLVYHGNQRLLEYDFVVAAGADPAKIDLRFDGARKLSVNREGALVIGMGGGEVIEPAPVVYQEIGGERKILAGRYVLRGRRRVGFYVSEYDRGQPLVIDPTLAYSTYLGGSSFDQGSSIAVDSVGNAYVTGFAGSSDFPTTPGAFQTTFGGQYYDAFVSKLNAAGSALVYSTFLGGHDLDNGVGIAIDASGNAYISGFTYSVDFPTTPGAFQTSLQGRNNAFVSKLNPSGSSLLYSTYLGGSGIFGDQGFGIQVDAAGEAYVAGFTSSPDFPTTPGAFQRVFVSGEMADAFVSKLSTDGSKLVYSTFVGPLEGNPPFGLAIDSSGSAYITGGTGNGFPTTPGAFQTVGGSQTAFVSKLNPAGSALAFSTYLGTLSWGNAVAVDGSGNVYVTGYTNATFPTTPGALQTTFSGTEEPFISKLNASGSALIYSTYLGSYGDGLGIAIDSAGNAYVTGQTFSSDFPTTADAFQTSFGGGDDDVFVSELNASGSELLYSTFLGGTNDEEGLAIAVDSSGNFYVTGYALSDFPTTAGAFQTAFAGVQDAYVTKFSTGSVTTGPRTTATFNGPSGENGWYVGAVTVTLNATAGTNPISATYYSVNGGPYRIYASPFVISADGVYQISFYSVDTTGIQEPPHGPTLKIDSTPPVSHVLPLPPIEPTPSFTVQWTVTDATSGLADTTIFVSDNGGPFVPALHGFVSTQATFNGVAGHTYGFYSIAQDVAGNVEAPKTAAEATTTVAEPSRPVSHVAPLPATETVANFLVQWSGTDAGGPGIQSYTIYVSDDGGPYTIWYNTLFKNAIGLTQAWFAGTAGHTYGFYSIAQDLAGNQENPKTNAEAATTVASVVPGDVNGDGQVNCLDIDAVKASFGLKAGQPGFNPKADVNHDGVVNVLDLAMVAQKLIPGTTCQ